MTKASILSARWLGRIAYADGLALQRQAAEEVKAGSEETLFLLEHEPVFTLGRNASRADVLFPPARCAELGITVVETDRGGKITYHGPGQLVGYPILEDFGIAAERSPLRERVSSLWVGNDKIAAIGIHISRWVTTHGFALNVTNEPLPSFGGIVPCGITDGGVTTMERQLGRALPLDEVAGRVAAHFGAVFGREIIPS